jgi:hypothetical protein
MTTSAEKGRHLLCKQEESEIHMLLICKKTEWWRQKLFKSLNSSKEILYKKITRCVKSTKLETKANFFTQDEIKDWKTKWQKLCKV